MGNFANVFKQLRKDRNYNQVSIAKALGISRSAVGMYESGQRVPAPEDLEKIADFFNVDMDFLMGRSKKSTFYIDPETAAIAKKISKCAENIVVMDMYLELDAGRKTQADSYIRYLHTEWEEEYGTEKRTADVVQLNREKDHLLPNAAHEVNPTPEQKKHADDIMFNDDEWK